MSDAAEAAADIAEFYAEKKREQQRLGAEIRQLIRDAPTPSGDDE